MHKDQEHEASTTPVPLQTRTPEINNLLHRWYRQTPNHRLPTVEPQNSPLHLLRKLFACEYIQQPLHTRVLVCTIFLSRRIFLNITTPPTTTTRHMSELVAPTPTRAGDGAAAASGGDGAANPNPAVQAVAELAGERASPPPATFSAVINIKCPDQTGVVSGRETIRYNTHVLVVLLLLLLLLFHLPSNYSRCVQHSFHSTCLTLSLHCFVVRR